MPDQSPPVATATDRSLLKRLDAGLYLLDPVPGSTMYRFATTREAKAVVFRMRADVVQRSIDAGWIVRGEKGDWCLTDSGRAQLEVSTFVRVFCETAPITP